MVHAWLSNAETPAEIVARNLVADLYADFDLKGLARSRDIIQDQAVLWNSARVLKDPFFARLDDDYRVFPRSQGLNAISAGGRSSAMFEVRLVRKLVIADLATVSDGQLHIDPALLRAIDAVIERVSVRE